MWRTIYLDWKMNDWFENVKHRCKEIIWHSIVSNILNQEFSNFDLRTLKNNFIYVCIFGHAGLHCCDGFFSSCDEWGLLSSGVWILVAMASLVVEHGHQACRLQQLWHVGSVVVAPGPQSTGSVVAAHQAQLLQGTWDFPGPGIKHLFPALAGGFFTNEPPGMPSGHLYTLKKS